MFSAGQVMYSGFIRGWLVTAAAAAAAANRADEVGEAEVVDQKSKTMSRKTQKRFAELMETG